MDKVGAKAGILAEMARDNSLVPVRHVLAMARKCFCGSLNNIMRTGELALIRFQTKSKGLLMKIHIQLDIDVDPSELNSYASAFVVALQRIADELPQKDSSSECKQPTPAKPAPAAETTCPEPLGSIPDREMIQGYLDALRTDEQHPRTIPALTAFLLTPKESSRRLERLQMLLELLFNNFLLNINITEQVLHPLFRGLFLLPATFQQVIHNFFVTRVHHRLVKTIRVYHKQPSELLSNIVLLSRASCMLVSSGYLAPKLVFKTVVDFLDSEQSCIPAIVLFSFLDGICSDRLEQSVPPQTLADLRRRVNGLLSDPRMSDIQAKLAILAGRIGGKAQPMADDQDGSETDDSLESLLPDARMISPPPLSDSLYEGPLSAELTEELPSPAPVLPPEPEEPEMPDMPEPVEATEETPAAVADETAQEAPKEEEAHKEEEVVPSEDDKALLDDLPVPSIVTQYQRYRTAGKKATPKERIQAKKYTDACSLHGHTTLARSVTIDECGVVVSVGPDKVVSHSEHGLPCDSFKVQLPAVEGSGDDQIRTPILVAVSGPYLAVAAVAMDIHKFGWATVSVYRRSGGGHWTYLATTRLDNVPAVTALAGVRGGFIAATCRRQGVDIVPSLDLVAVNTEGGCVLTRLSAVGPHEISNLAVAPDGKHYSFVTTDGALTVGSIDKASHIAVDSNATAGHPVISITMPAEDTVVFGTTEDGGMVCVYSAKERRVLQMSPSARPPLSIASVDNDRLAVITDSSLIIYHTLSNSITNGPLNGVYSGGVVWNKTTGVISTMVGEKARVAQFKPCWDME
ncbi:hypothetical protein J8273_4050 [Carpediemonas membranifera]|uniref:Uncharacterized protein n=1 Tax=Carpediemonas membranifera TaxID=201153 RepID=A0A8J6E2J6_9EUKA|nr:hypothetical protein J8273_4050 [Carpediemonas membranifera]|eukprot:KAG9394406.1 hypothetical protein J8273_4050 [Carpediemonas membranifera]